MRIMHVETLLAKGDFAKSKEWAEIKKALHEAITKVDWPAGSGKFTIYPESGKKRGEGNGVTPIKARLLEQLKVAAWMLEEPMDIATLHKPEGFRAKRLVVVGVGKAKRFTSYELRKAAGAAVRA